MGCNRSTVRVGPAHLGKVGKDRKTASHFQQTRQRMWRRMVRFGVVKVAPAKLGGGDSPIYEAKCPVQPESVLYTDNKPHTGLLTNQRRIKTAWGEINPAQAKILLELQAQGIVSFNATASGAISFSVGDQQTHSGDGGALPPRRPPARLARLNRVPSLPDSKKAEQLENKMKAAEARRKNKQEALKDRLRAHSRLGQQHHDEAAEAERALKEKAAVKIAAKQAAFQERMDRKTEDRMERARAKSRTEEHAREFVMEADELVRFEAAETIAKKQDRYEAHVHQHEVERVDRIRAKSRMGERAKKVAEDLANESQEKAAETVAKKQKIVESNNERRARFRNQRVLLNERHRENIRRALARRLAEEEDNAQCDMDYEIETAQDSADEDEDFFEPELKWLM